MFSSKVTLDSMINAVKSAGSDILDVLLVGDVNGKLLVKYVASHFFFLKSHVTYFDSIFESFVVGQLHLSTLNPQLGMQCKVPPLLQ